MSRFLLSSLLFCVLLGALPAQDAKMNASLDAIRGNEAELTAFFQQMPKGGDLHHHYSGSIYAESYLQIAIEDNMWVNVSSLEVAQAKGQGTDWLQFSALEQAGQLTEYRERLLRSWSCKDYPFEADLPPDQHFFATFGRFGVTQGDFGPETMEDFGAGLLELKHRAQLENVQYIETMFSGIPKPAASTETKSYNAALSNLQAAQNAAAMQDTLNALAGLLTTPEMLRAMRVFVATLGETHQKLVLDDTSFTMRYQTYTLRNREPVEVFYRLLMGFMAADASPLIVGVNIVAPENDPVSLRDYWMHMQMYRYLHARFPQVRYAMHAGELALGQTPPEAMSNHIREAVLTAGASRIGHGVDIPYETNNYALLDSMRTRDVAVEINLSSNAFILGISGGRHPVLLYRHARVPFVISTDDAGVLRSNLTEQYVLLAHQYPEFSYTDIKALVFNSINYSFIEESDVKTALLAQLEMRFAAFENQVLSRH